MHTCDHIHSDTCTHIHTFRNIDTTVYDTHTISSVRRVFVALSQNPAFHILEWFRCRPILFLPLLCKTVICPRAIIHLMLVKIGCCFNFEICWRNLPSTRMIIAYDFVWATLCTKSLSCRARCIRSQQFLKTLRVYMFSAILKVTIYSPYQIEYVPYHRQYIIIQIWQQLSDLCLCPVFCMRWFSFLINVKEIHLHSF